MHASYLCLSTTIMIVPVWYLITYGIIIIWCIYSSLCSLVKRLPQHMTDLHNNVGWHCPCWRFASSHKTVDWYNVYCRGSFQLDNNYMRALLHDPLWLQCTLQCALLGQLILKYWHELTPEQLTSHVMLFEGQFIVPPKPEHDDVPMQITWLVSNVELLHEYSPLQFTEAALSTPLL